MSLTNVIRCDLPQNDYLIWKWEPDKDSKSRQNQIRYGSSLRVRMGETAVFFYSPGGGAPSLDYIDGPADLILETKNLPVISSIIGLAYGGDTPFQAEVYFINKGKATQLKWGIPWFDAFDPRFADIPVPVCANGTITFEIANVPRFVEIQGLRISDPSLLREQIIPQIRMAVKSSMVGLATARGIPLVQIGGRLEDLSILLQPTITKVLEGFGTSLRNFVFEGIEIDKESDGYKDLADITRRQAVENLKTQGEMGRKNMVDSQSINSTHLAESQRIQREQLEKRQSLQTESDFLPVHQINRQADVSQAAAESIGHLGRGAGSGEGAGIASTAMALGMALPIGQIFGQKIIGGLEKTLAPSGTIPCSRCNTQIQQGAKFCPACGNQASQPATVASCGRCNLPLQTGAKFCPACGTPAAPTLPACCSRCNANLQPGVKFCPFCGSPANSASAPPNCGRCGEKMQPGVKFCPSCGAAAM
jgi:membrane protease subunit (stomatin/prohibitin family)